MATWVAWLTMSVLVVATYAVKDRILEEWWLYRLEGGDEEAQKAAAQRLGEIRSTRAIPLLIERMGWIARHYPARIVFSRQQRKPQIQQFQIGSTVTFGVPPQEMWAANWPGQALSRIGAAVVPPLLDATRGADHAFTALIPGHIDMRATYNFCTETLARIGDTAIPGLRGACCDEDPVVRAVAAAALRKIESAHALPR